jgi:hypothetical protein
MDRGDGNCVGMPTNKEIVDFLDSGLISQTRIGVSLNLRKVRYRKKYANRRSIRDLSPS